MQRTAQEVVESIQRSRSADWTFAYAIPGAELGYQDGYGAVYDWLVAGPGAASHKRVIPMAAVKNDVAVSVTAVGPYRRSDHCDGHPSPANTPVAGFIDAISNTIRFPGDPRS